MIGIILFFVLILYALSVIYLTGVFIFFPGKPQIGNAPVEPVSIVIPCKNEAPNLPSLVASIGAQEYPAAIEAIFIDDGSSDETALIIERARRTGTFPIKLLVNPHETTSELTSKQQALDLGIREASHALIALTDADMLLDRLWLRSMAGSLRQGVDLVFGHTAILPGRSLFTAFQSFQLAFLFSIAAAFHYCGVVGSCMGNNVMLRKTAYLECGGFAAIGYSITEDRALLRHFRRCRRATGIVIPFYPTAFTAPCGSLQLFFQQASRWASGGFADGASLLGAGLLFTLQNILLLAGVYGLLPGKLYVAALINFFLTWGLVLIGFKKIRSPISGFFFPLYFPLLIIETVALLPVLLRMKRVIWKEKRV